MVVVITAALTRGAVFIRITGEAPAVSQRAIVLRLVMMVSGGCRRCAHFFDLTP